ncbi:hypothetical protein PoB_006213700 [Plakobranchus ocellatus]|uniref:Uncharacterized protein n=1 Tax=Plakobranchus ocellatus TaxID=259542 RepID=A0AAV4CUP2_9GAST|nr:hypothetical protein PoB_006213700 [Plakobranchus ocellatus]
MVDAILLTGEGKNCQEDLDAFLFSFEHIASQGAPKAVQSRVRQELPRNLQPLLQRTIEQTVLSASEDSIMTYVSGYVARKLQSIVCGECKSVLVEEHDITQPSHTFLIAKQYSGCLHKGLLAPSAKLKKVLEVAENVFRANAASFLVSTSLRYKLVRRMFVTATGCDLVCPEGKCELTLMALNLFTNVRLYHYIKCYNLTMAAENQKKTTKRKISTLRHK